MRIEIKKGYKMSDKDKNPDFQIEIDDDELELNLEDNIFDEKNKESDDLLTEEELENLIIGIDEENDILDIPDEEEVLEELKFFDESFALPKDEPKEEKEEVKPEKKTKVKKEKAPKAPKTPREPIDWQFFILKNKFKILGGFILIVVLSFVLTFVLVLKSHPKVEETVATTTSESTIVEEKPAETISEEPSKETEVESLSPVDEEIKILKEELNKETDEHKKLELQKSILKLEEEKIDKTQEKKVEELKKYYDEVLPTVTTAVIKIEDDILVLALIVQNDNFKEELYKALEKTFEDKYQINRVSLSILKRTKNLNKIGELNVEQKKFEEIKEKHISVDEKIKSLGYQKR